MSGHEPTRGAFYSNVDILKAIKGGRINVKPFNPKMLQPASLEVRLYHRFRISDSRNHTVIDPSNLPINQTREIGARNKKFVLHPGEFVLGSTLEIIHIPDDLIARIEGKSSLGRIGLVVHATAGFVDPGWNGRLTLELANIARLPILLRPGMKIGQLSFADLKTPTTMPYGSEKAKSHYQGSMGPVESR